MLCFKIRTIGFWEYLVYTIGLSVAFIMFAGLHANWTLPAFGITDKPLSTIPILIEFDVFLLILSFFAYMRNKDLKFKIKFPKFTSLDRIFIIIPMFFPVLSVLGAFLLNNNGPNILTMIMLGGIAVYVFFVVLFHKKLNENVYPWALYLLGLSLLLASSLRSWSVSAVDINLEYWLFNLTYEKSFWSINNFKNVYNAMLSVTILPSLLFSFLKINPQYILKLVTNFIFPILPIIIYVSFGRLFQKPLSFLAAFFFISQPMFISWSSIPIRQQIAFLFFGLMILVLFSKEINPKLKKSLFFIFGFSMIVSHYSTSYIALAIFLLTTIKTYFYKKYENKKIRKGKLKYEKKQKFYLNWIIILILLIFCFIWYAQLSNTGDGIIHFAKRSFSNIQNMFNEDVQVQGQTPIQNFNIFYKPTQQNDILNGYINKTLGSNATFNKQAFLRYPLGNKIWLDANFFNLLILIKRSFDIIGRILIIFGMISLLIMVFRGKFANIPYFIIILASFLALSFVAIMPFISIAYDLARTYQHGLIVLSSAVIFGIIFLTKRIKSPYNFIIMGLFFSGYFIFMSGAVNQLMGGMEVHMKLNNNGLEYSRYYAHNSEILSGIWLKNLVGSGDTIFIDSHTKLRPYLIWPETIRKISKTDLLPGLINRRDYVFKGYSNINDQVIIKVFRGNLISYNFPTEFLNDNKNMIYNNGGSQIFK
jgi:uncharacterized membrane protein